MANPVFISYSRADRAYVERLARHLRSNAISATYDTAVSVGDHFPTVLQEMIQNCMALVVVLSPSACASKWVKREMLYAEARGKPVLPLMLVACDPPLQLSDVQYEDVTNERMPTEQFVARLRPPLPGTESATKAATRTATQPAPKTATRTGVKIETAAEAKAKRVARRAAAARRTPSDVEVITAEITKALKNRSPLPMSRAVQLVQETTPWLAKDWTGTREFTTFVRTHLRAFVCVSDDGGYLWLASGPKPTLPPAPKNALPAQGAPGRPARTKRVPVVAGQTAPRPLGPPSRAELVLVRRALRAAWWEHRPLPLGTASEAVRAVVPDMAITWGGVGKFTTFVERFLARDYVCQGGHLWLAPSTGLGGASRRFWKLLVGP